MARFLDLYKARSGEYPVSVRFDIHHSSSPRPVQSGKKCIPVSATCLIIPKHFTPTAMIEVHQCEKRCPRC
jgi:hypothetical protein